MFDVTDVEAIRRAYNAKDRQLAELYQQLEAANVRIAQLESEQRDMQALWEPLRKWAQERVDAGLARPGMTCFDTALQYINELAPRVEITEEMRRSIR